MPKGNTWAADVLALLFNATPIPNIAINATSSPNTNLYVSLHTANPGATGGQNTSEAAYTSYARVAVARTSGGWSLAGETITPVANITFPTATGGSETETYMGLGTASTGAGVLLYSGAISPTIPVANGTTPILTTATTITES
jgi:hypothetical protein